MAPMSATIAMMLEWFMISPEWIGSRNPEMRGCSATASRDKIR